MGHRRIEEGASTRSNSNNKEEKREAEKKNEARWDGEVVTDRKNGGEG